MMDEFVYNREVSRNQQYIILVILIILSFLVPFLLIRWKEIPPPRPRAKNGVINLENWNFLKHGNIRLDGEWKFKPLDDNPTYKDNLYVDSNTPDKSDRVWELLNIPTGYYYMGVDNSSTYHWLRFWIMLPPPEQRGRLELSYTSEQMPANVYIDGIEYTISGSERLLKNNFTIPLPESNVILVAIRIPNIYRNTNAFNIKAEILALDYKEPAREGETFYLALVAGIMLIMIIYHFMLWFDNREDKASFFLMLYSLIIFCRVVSTYIFTEKVITGSAGDLLRVINLKFLYLNHPLGWVFFLTFLLILLQEEINNAILLFFQIAGTLISLVTLVADNYRLLAVINQIITILACLWIILFLLQAIKHKKEGAGIILAGIGIYTAAIMNDILLDYRLIRTVYLSEWGYVLFLFFYSRYQSLFFTRASRKAQYLTLNIDHEIEKQTYTLKKQKNELERVNRVLDSQKRKLEEINTKQREIDLARTTFFQNISHEFRTPLTLILAPLESVLSGRYGDVSPELQKPLRIIRDNSMRLRMLINQVLELARIENGKISLEPEKMDLVKLFRCTTAVFESLALRRNIRYQVDIPDGSFYSCVDKSKIETIIGNLLSNAFKFTDNEGMVTAGLKAVVCGEGTDGKIQHNITITVTDTGIGIPENELPYIFDRFRQVDSSLTRRYEGTGIGLSLAKEYTELLGGTINVRSEPGRGTEFTVRFTVECPPYSGESAACEPADTQIVPAFLPGGEDSFPAELPEETRMAGDKQCILVIENNGDMRSYICSELNTKYRVYEAVHGRDGLKKLAHIPRPDLIICDVMMEEMDGFSFYKTISTDQRLNTIPVIFLTARSGIEEKLTGLALGAVDYLYKPFHRGELLLKIDALLQNQKLKLALYEKDKYAGIGMLFGGILHEIMNPLNTILAPLENLERNLARMALMDNPRFIKYFEQIYSSLERIEKLIKSSKLLFYKKEGESEEIDINGLLASIRDIFYNKIKTRIMFTTMADMDVKIYSDYNALTHILINLVSNAIDAIKTRGEISIKVFAINGKPVIVVKDTGTGIKKENITRIFDPFYTEKEAGKGTGMGLYFVKTLIAKIGWTIEVFSEEGKGSEFMLSCG